MVTVKVKKIIQHSGECKITILIVYVNDIILTCDDNVELERLKKKLIKDFKIKDLGVLKYFFGMEFSRSKKGKFSLNKNIYLIYLVK